MFIYVCDRVFIYIYIYIYIYTLSLRPPAQDCYIALRMVVRMSGVWVELYIPFKLSSEPLTCNDLY